jgi:hypothetical protein
MFCWYKAKCLNSARISIQRQFWGFASLPNFTFFAKIFAKLAIFRKAAVSESRAKGDFQRISKKSKNWQFGGSKFHAVVIPSSFKQRKKKRKDFFENQTELCGFPWLTSLVSMWAILWVA